MNRVRNWSERLLLSSPQAASLETGGKGDRGAAGMGVGRQGRGTTVSSGGPCPSSQLLRSVAEPVKPVPLPGPSGRAESPGAWVGCKQQELGGREDTERLLLGLSASQTDTAPGPGRVPAAGPLLQAGSGTSRTQQASSPMEHKGCPLLLFLLWTLPISAVSATRARDQGTYLGNMTGGRKTLQK